MPPIITPKTPSWPDRCGTWGGKVPVLTGDGAQVPELPSIGGTAVEGLYFTAHFHRQGAGTPRGSNS